MTLKQRKMGRKIFKEHGFIIEGKILPLESFRVFSDRENGLVFSNVIKKQILEQAETLLDKEYPSIYATDYMMYKRNGNRTVFEAKQFARRNDMLTLAYAEYIERQGRYTDKLCDLVWLILEETTWVLPAHNRVRAGVNSCLSYEFGEEVDYIDLFSGATGASLACVYYLCRDILDGVTPLIRERILYELDRRIITPFCSEYLDAWTWTGRDRPANNWCPWIISNVLTVCALTVDDINKREKTVRLSMECLDGFTASYYSDGCCEEGPGYWSGAAGAFYNACLVLCDMSDGYINVFGDPLIVNMAEYIAKVHISGDYYVNFADAHPRVNSASYWMLDFALLCGSQLMESFVKNKINGNEPKYSSEWMFPYRGLRVYGCETATSAEFVPPKKVWFDGTEVAITRECETSDKWLYLAVKGGHNAETGHNHNDVGNFIVYSDGKPLFIDLGVGEYTSKTFSRRRYEIPSMRSEYHNLPTFNGVCQQNGRAFETRDCKYNPESGELKIDLTAAYPPEAGIESYIRQACLENREITVSDSFVLKDDGNAVFNFVTCVHPKNICENSFEIEGRSVTFDSTLSLAVEEIDCTSVEMSAIPSDWDSEKIWRITLSAPFLSGRKSYSFELKIR